MLTGAGSVCGARRIIALTDEDNAAQDRGLANLATLRQADCSRFPPVTQVALELFGFKIEDFFPQGLRRRRVACKVIALF